MHDKRMEVRWRDMDAFGHVNSAVFVTYLEEVRDEWLEKVIGSVSDIWDFVLVRVAIDYRRELKQSDDQVIARLRLTKIGTSSIHTSQELRAKDGRLVVEADTIVVARDRRTGDARPLTPQERIALEHELAIDGEES